MQTSDGGNKFPVAIGACVVIIAAIIAALVLGIKLGSGTGKAEETEESTKRNVVINESNIQEVLEEISQQETAEPVSPGYYTVTMTNEWHFANGEAVSEDAYVANVEGNTNDVYFDVVLSGNEEDVVYKSPVIPRGEELRNIALDKSLDAGEHDCIVIFHLVDEEQNTVDTLRVRLAVIVGQ